MYYIVRPTKRIEYSHQLYKKQRNGNAVLMKKKDNKNIQVNDQGPELQCLLKVKQYLS